MVSVGVMVPLDSINSRRTGTSDCVVWFVDYARDQVCNGQVFTGSSVPFCLSLYSCSQVSLLLDLLGSR